MLLINLFSRPSKNLFLDPRKKHAILIVYIRIEAAIFVGSLARWATFLEVFLHRAGLWCVTLLKSGFNGGPTAILRWRRRNSLIVQTFFIDDHGSLLM